MRRATGWDPITYLWNDEQTEAQAGASSARACRSPGSIWPGTSAASPSRCRTPTSARSATRSTTGWSARSDPRRATSTRTMRTPTAPRTSSTRWTAVGYLAGAPEPGAAPRAAGVRRSGQPARVEARARAYLDVNCGHCHNPSGLARTSGLYLNIDETNPARYGVCKPPVAAGQGSGDREVDIVPGQPERVDPHLSHGVDRARRRHARARPPDRAQRGAGRDQRVDRGAAGELRVGAAARPTAVRRSASRCVAPLA